MKKIRILTLGLLLIAMVSIFAACGGGGAPSEITLNKTELTMLVGDTEKLEVTVTPDNASADIVWTSSDETVAQVAEDGTVSAVGEGMVVITATSALDESVYADCELIVNSEEIVITFVVDGETVATRTANSGERVWPPDDPVKQGYAFDGWYTAAEGGEKVTDFTRMMETATYYAHFTESSGPIERSFTFEGEYIDFTGKVGSGISGSALGTGMLQSEYSDASNGWAIGFLHGAGIELTWNITSDSAAEADFYIRMASELGTMVMDPSTFEIAVNGDIVQYDIIELIGDSGVVFDEYKLNVPVQLQEGENSIVITIKENTFANGTSTGGPIIDYIRLTTTAILTWEPIYNVVTN